MLERRADQVFDEFQERLDAATTFEMEREALLVMHAEAAALLAEHFHMLSVSGGLSSKDGDALTDAALARLSSNIADVYQGAEAPFDFIDLAQQTVADAFRCRLAQLRTAPPAGNA